MIIFPAIDILDGQCVRLIQGDYNQEKVYSNSPIDMAKKWEAKGAEFIHSVDLDGAKTGDSINKKVIKDIAETVSIPVQVGGGIRSLDIIATTIEHSVDDDIMDTVTCNETE